MKHQSVILFCAFLVLMVGCGKKTAGNHAKAINVEVLTLTDTARVDSCSANRLERIYMGSVEESSNASLNFVLGGKVTNVFVSEGDRVCAGQQLVCIDAADADASLATAKAQLDQAKDAYNRVKSVYEKGGVSEVRWVDVQTKLAQAQSVYDIANQNVSNRVLTAPFNGVVGELNATIGDHLLPGQTAVKIMNVDVLSVAFYVPESEVRKLDIGERVMVDCPSLGLTFSALIQEKSPVANRLSHSYKVKARLKETQSALLPGMNCKIRVAQNNITGFVIPGSAVQTHQDGLYCWVVRNDRAQRVKIKSDTFVNNGVLVSEGLNVGDKIIISGYQKLYNGAEIEY